MASSDPISVLGVRHHGPGSARAVARALDQLDPSAVVIEGPGELDRIVALAGRATMVPPVAGLVYDVAEPRRATFYPLAVFSPEWVALRWALDRGRPVHFADLPAANQLAPTEPPEQDEPAPASPRDSDPSDSDPSDSEPEAEHGIGLSEQQIADPLGALAAAAGYDDAERWWEDAIEQRQPDGDPLAQFASVGEAMATFRHELGPGGLDLRTRQREAAMRKTLRRLRRGTEGPLAVVCGAFHAPALQPDAWPSAQQDNALLQGLPKTRVAATWAPWTSNRLALASGYGAGVQAPGWYHHLYTTGDDVIATWMVRLARALRAQGHDASSASAVEATRLAETLAAMRGRPLAGLDEINDAALTVLCHGVRAPLHGVTAHLLVGEDLGTVPPETPSVPLAEDLARQQRSLRLKPTSTPRTVVVDLRRPSQRARSVLFHRLDLLGIHWAHPVDAGRSKGTFKEGWELQWEPELAVAVIEASLHGTTITSATAAKVVEDAANAPDLTTLAQLVEGCLPAELPNALTRVLALLADRTANQPDQAAIMAAVGPLARATRYGDVRQVDTSLVGEVVTTMITRAALGLTTACASLDDEAAATMRDLIETVTQGVALVADPALTTVWQDALAAVSTSGVHGLVAGRVTRLLLDGGAVTTAEAGRRLERALSPASGPAGAAAWLDGFLSGDVALIVNDPDLFTLIDRWLSGLDPDDFDDLLPLVRRTFARFEPAERRQIGELVSRGTSGGATTDPAVDIERGAGAGAKVAELLGLRPPDRLATIGVRP